MNQTEQELETALREVSKLEISSTLKENDHAELVEMLKQSRESFNFQNSEVPGLEEAFSKRVFQITVKE